MNEFFYEPTVKVLMLKGEKGKVYGRSDTVQPPAFVVNIWVRTA